MVNTKVKITNSIHRDEWLTEFFQVLFNLNITEQEMAIVMGKIINHYSKRNEAGIEEPLVFAETNRQARFFLYLNSIKEKLTPEYIQEGVDQATASIQGDEFIDKFIRYIVATNYSDIFVSTGIREEEDYLYTYSICRLGDYPLAEMQLYGTPTEILFDDVEVNKNVRRMGIGTMLFNGVMSDIHEIFPHKKLYSDNVYAFNIPAVEFYASLGAEIVKKGTEEIIVEFTPETISKVYQKNKQ